MTTMVFKGKTFRLVTPGKSGPACRVCAFGSRPNEAGYGCDLPVGESNACVQDADPWAYWEEAPSAFGCDKRANGGERCEKFCGDEGTCVTSQ